MRSSYVATISRRHVARHASTRASSHACRKDTLKQKTGEALIAELEADLAPLSQAQRATVMEVLISRYRGLDGEFFREVVKVLEVQMTSRIGTR